MLIEFSVKFSLKLQIEAICSQKISNRNSMQYHKKWVPL